MKITVIGGAGVRTVIFINGLLKRYKELHIDKVVLYDINREKQKVIHKLCKHVVRREGEELIVEMEENIEKAVIGADYIVTTIRVGSDYSRVIDENIAFSQGVIGQETTGAGGFFMAARAVPVLLDYCSLIEKLAPDAWIFNFSNPSGLVTQALRDEGYKKVIGICDAPSSTKFRMAQYLGVKEEELCLEFFGLNHLSWIRSVKKEGQEILKELLQDDHFLGSIQEFSVFDKDLLRFMGYLPNEYLYYYYHREKVLEHIKQAGETRGRTIEKGNRQMMEELYSMDIDQDPEQALQTFLYYMEVRERSYMSIETGDKRDSVPIEKGNLPVPDGMGYAGVMLDCIEGLQGDKGKYLVLCVENNECIEGLEDKDIIEVTCKVQRNEILPMPIGAIPESQYLLIRTVKQYEKLAIQSIKEKNRELSIWALTGHPLINSYSIAKKLIEEYERVSKEEIENAL